MSKLLLISVVLTSSFVFAQGQKKSAGNAFSRPYGLAGCGLGSVLIGKRGGQITASTTNATAFNQMIGITAGTLNCVDTASTEVANRMDQFIMINRSQVQGDIARGNGETIAALSQYMGCSVRPELLGSTLKSQYPNIFVSGAAANEVTDGIISAVLSQPEVAQSCQKLG